MTIRFVDVNSNFRKQFVSFVDFIYSEGTTGENLSREILETIDKIGLDRSKTRTQCYDGAGNIAGKVNGVCPIIQKQYPKAITVYCPRLYHRYCSQYNVKM